MHIYDFIAPEWRKLDRHEKERASWAAARALGWRRGAPLLALAIVIAIALLNLPYKQILVFSSVLIPGLLSILAYRAAIRPACRAVLAARGEPVCTDCGYNLSGNVSGRCPECGNATDSAASAE